MNKIIFFDTETTGNTEKDFLCQIAYKNGEESFVGFYRPPIKIPPEASAVHHITNKMLEDKPIFSESVDFKKIKELFEDKDSIVVAHNAPFDLMIIKKEGIIPTNFICTLRLARYLDPDEKIEKYNLQYLRYFLDIEIDADAHNALGDVLVLEQLYKRLQKKIMEQLDLNENEAMQKMIEISSHPSIFKTIKFGKHNGKSIEEIMKVDRGYLEWLLAQKIESGQPDEDWIYTLKYYLKK
ncbi:MAG: Exonuclease RNase T and DNA polymerase III [Parcubacteria group bacterium GW2011_GWF2_38_8]|nr:MAG: Exonuclease RNase T and DNA polymerase III [Parcubacteria group bacterium GW2011_GWF2_38_8]